MPLPAIWDRIGQRVPWCNATVFAATFDLALEIAREGREGRRVGTIFIVGNSQRVLESSRALILDPLAGHAPHATHVGDPQLRGTLKELAQLDGAFVVDQDGTVLAACRYLDASAEGVAVPFGLGSRHLAAAAISQQLAVVAIVVSASGVVRVFHGGELIGEDH